MNSKFLTVECFVVSVVWFFVMLLVIVPGTTIRVTEKITDKFHKELVNRGFAEYDGKTGEWKYREVFVVNDEEEKLKLSPLEEVMQSLPEINKHKLQEDKQEEGLPLIPFILADVKSKK